MRKGEDQTKVCKSRETMGQTCPGEGGLKGTACFQLLVSVTLWSRCVSLS